MKKTITHDEYLKGLGLLHLAQHHNTKATEFSEALHSLMGIKDGDVERWGHLCDAAYEATPLDTVLRKMGIKVKAK